MNNAVKIADTGLEEYPKSRIIIGNIMMLLWIVVGTIAVWFLSPLAAGLYLVIAVIVVYVVLRKLVCTNCYYYNRWCSLGWGKLAALMFKQGKIEDFNTSVGLTLAPIVYGLLTFIPIVIIILLLVVAFDYTQIIMLVVLLFFAFYSGSIGRKSACTNCKMRTTCKGSVAKN